MTRVHLAKLFRIFEERKILRILIIIITNRENGKNDLIIINNHNPLKGRSNNSSIKIFKKGSTAKLVKKLDNS